METNCITKHFKGVQKLNKLYVLISVCEPSLLEYQNFNESHISIFDFESYFKSNILLQYGILGYLGFPFKVIEYIKSNRCFIVQTNNESLSKLQLIVNNSFPAHNPIEFSFNGIKSNCKLKFVILKFNNSLSSIINDDISFNT